MLGLTAWNLTRSDALTDAQTAEQRGEDLIAVRHALDHLERRPWSRDASRIAARGLSRLGHVDPAETYYARAGTLDREDLQARAFGLLRADRRDESGRVYESILERWPDDPTALRQLAVLRRIQGELAAAIALSERLAKVPGHEVVGLTMLGTYQDTAQDPEKVVAAFDQVIDRDPTLRKMPLPHGTFWETYGRNLLAVGRTETVRRQLGRILHGSETKDLQDDAGLWTMLGQAYQLEGDFAAAEDTFRWAARLDPRRFEAWNALGQVLLASNRPEDALEPLNRALALDPNSWSAVYSLILANTRLGRVEDVESLRVRADEIRRSRGVPTTGMGGPPSLVKTPSS